MPISVSAIIAYDGRVILRETWGAFSAAYVIAVRLLGKDVTLRALADVPHILLVLSRHGQSALSG
ncbi:MAG: hypothetical protein WA375_25545, partial [Pseudolabrys sp.]